MIIAYINQHIMEGYTIEDYNIEDYKLYDKISFSKVYVNKEKLIEKLNAEIKQTLEELLYDDDDDDEHIDISCIHTHNHYTWIYPITEDMLDTMRINEMLSVIQSTDTYRSYCKYVIKREIV